MKPLILLVQPPFVQLNSPYPGVYYLRSFLEKRGYRVIVRDHSIGLFEKIFCKNGLERIFSDIRKIDVSLMKDKQLKPVIERFLSEEKQWLFSIDRIVDFLKGRDREWGYFIALANGQLPGGPFFDACLEEIQKTRGEASVEDSQLLASKLMADIAGLITAVLDSGFSLIRYLPSLAAGFRNFSTVENSLDSYIMQNFYRTLLEDEWKTFAMNGDFPLLLGITIPFPGCLTGALYCARSAKAFFHGKVIIAAGGGYVNTELRFLEDENVFNYFDYLSFDRGYGSLAAILNHNPAQEQRDDIALYKTMYRNKNGCIVRDGAINGESTDAAGSKIDNDAVQSVFPDYSGVDFSRYICPVDDVNPMHRLWSGGKWLKAFASYGCYWHNCAFCDVSLDYIRSYRPADINSLFRHLLEQSRETGVRGVHLVDEACPPSSLLKLALLNREAGLPLIFWGNIRFEKYYTPDIALLLAAGGVIGVCAGIEIATESGFKSMGKGIVLEDVVNACAAFKEAGILVHSYLIYGYWDQDNAGIMDSAETMRQLFASALIDSAFWHKFVLTVHSRLYAEKLKGLHPQLQPLCENKCGGNEKLFALNDLSFNGMERFDRFDLPLDLLLKEWMRGNTSVQVQDALGFKTKKPSVPQYQVESLLDNYARNRNKVRRTLLSQPENSIAVFIPSRVIIRQKAKGAQLFWRWRFEDCVLSRELSDNSVWAQEAASLLEEACKGINAADFYKQLQTIFSDETQKAWKQLRQQGLVLYKN